MGGQAADGQVAHIWYTRPVLFVADIGRSVRFYTEALGFRKAWHEADGKGTVCQVDRGGCEIILCEDSARGMDPRAGDRRSAGAMRCSMLRFWFILLLAFACATPGAAQSAGERANRRQHVERQLRQLNQDVADMQVRKDASAAERLLADDYVFLQADGNVSNKAQNVAAIRDPAFVCQSLIAEDVKVRVYGDAAVVTGRVVMRATYGGQDVGGEFLYTDVWVKRDGRWQTVASQATRRSRLP